MRTARTQCFKGLMKTLRQIAMLLIVAALNAGLASCSDDDDNGGASGNADSASIVGTWGRNSGSSYYEEITFTLDGAYSSITTDISTGEVLDVNTAYGTYSISNGKLTIHTDSGWGYLYEDEYDYIINGNILTLREPGYEYIYIRVQ